MFTALTDTAQTVTLIAPTEGGGGSQHALIVVGLLFVGVLVVFTIFGGGGGAETVVVVQRPFAGFLAFVAITGALAFLYFLFIAPGSGLS